MCIRYVYHPVANLTETWMWRLFPCFETPRFTGACLRRGRCGWWVSLVGTSKHDLGRNCQAMYELGIASGMLLSALLNLLLQAIGGCFTHWSFPLRGSMWLKVKTLQKTIWWMPPSRRRIKPLWWTHHHLESSCFFILYHCLSHLLKFTLQFWRVLKIPQKQPFYGTNVTSVEGVLGVYGTES